MSVADGERRIVSVLVADVAGSTSIAEKLGPERAKFLFDDVVRLMREEVERFGGTVAQLTGDGLLALFGAPTAHEDGSERAVRAALAIREALDDYEAEVGHAYGLDLRARVAVNTGPVVIPAADAPPHVLYNALGDTVNVAARLQTFGDLVVGPGTARQVEASFELEDLGDLELKGRSEPVVGFRVVGVRERPVARAEAPFVGRKQDLASLSEVLDALLEGRGAIVSISGEPGIGKSRIVAEAEGRFHGRVRFLFGHAVPSAEAIPYWPMRDLLRGWLGLGVSDPEARVRLELRAELARTLAGEADEAYPFLAALLGLALEPDQERRMRDFAPDAVQRQTFDWIYQLVRTLAGGHPLCLVLEDLHWSDEATLSLLDELLPVVEQAALAFVLVHRSDPDHPAWQLVDRARRRFRPLFRELTLEPLPDAEAHALAEADAGGELPEELRQLLADRAGGNPYFVGEAIRDLRERGALQRENGRLVLVGEASVPAAIQEALQARLDRLDVEARELITVAAGHAWNLPALEISGNVYRGLVAIGRELEIQPDLAERFTVSDDGRSYRFTLRRDARWSDGVPVTAHDFAFSYAQMVEDEVIAAYLLDAVSACALDERTLEVRLGEPRSHFLYLLGSPALFAWPRHVYEREGRDWHRSVPLVGNGPFVLTSRGANRVVIEASPTWFGERGNVGEVTIELEAPGVAADRWRGGEYDVLQENFAPYAAATDQAIVERTPLLSTEYIGFNARRSPVDDPRVRRALAHAITRHGPAEAFRAAAAATGGIIPPAMPGHSHRVAPAFDPDRAHALLREAGYGDGSALGETVLAYMDLWEEASLDVAAQLEALGIRVRLLCTASDPELEAAIEGGAHHCFIWAWGASYPDPKRCLRPEGPVPALVLQRRKTRATAEPSGFAPRPGRAPASLPRVRADLDRRAGGRRATRVRGPFPVPAAVGHGPVAGRDPRHRLDLRGGRRGSAPSCAGGLIVCLHSI